MKIKMKSVIAVGIAVGCIGVASAEVAVTADLASAYVFRGVTFNDGPVFQPGIEASGFGLPETAGAVAFGAWGNYDLSDYNDSLETSELSELDLYFSYSLPTFVDGLDIFVGYCDYTYPSGGGDSDKEANMGAGYEVAGVGMGLTYYWTVDGSGFSYVEGTAGYGLDLTEELSASLDGTIGFADYDGGESGFNDFSLGGSVSYALSELWSVGASLTYVGQGDDKVLPDYDELTGSLGYDVGVVGMIGVSCEM